MAGAVVVVLVLPEPAFAAPVVAVELAAVVDGEVFEPDEVVVVVDDPVPCVDPLDPDPFEPVFGELVDVLVLVLAAAVVVVVVDDPDDPPPNNACAAASCWSIAEISLW